jgi:hypothetical protein
MEYAGTVETNDQLVNVFRFKAAPPGPKPTEHLSVLRNPHHRLNHSDAYLSPGLHNISSTYVRLLENEARSRANSWSAFLNSNAPAFTLGTARKHEKKRVCRVMVPSKVREYLLTCQKEKKAKKRAKAMLEVQEMKKAAERGDSYKYTADFDDDDSSYSEDDCFDWDHLYAADSGSSGTNTPSSSVEPSPVMNSGTGFYNMSEGTTSSLALSAVDGFKDPYSDSTNNQEDDTPAHPDNLRGVVTSWKGFTYLSDTDIASNSASAAMLMPLVYPDLPMPPPHVPLGLILPRCVSDHDERGDLALQTPQFALDLNESLDRALHDYENTTLSPIEGDSAVSLELSPSELRNGTCTIVEREPGEQGKVSKLFSSCVPTLANFKHNKKVFQRKASRQHVMFRLLDVEGTMQRRSMNMQRDQMMLPQEILKALKREVMNVRNRRS